MDKPYVIFSFDGGGIRGLIPAIICRYMEMNLDHKLIEYVDMVGGTSTGGIKACGMNVMSDGRPKYSFHEIVRLYSTEGYEIFEAQKQKGWRNMFGLLDNKYKNEGLEQVMLEYMGDGSISDSYKEMVVTAYDIERRRIHLFSSLKAKKDRLHDFTLEDAAIATAAAPTYFEPHQIRRSTDYFTLIDGGACGLANPTLVAIEEAQEAGIKPNQMVVVSFGTGQHEKAYTYERARTWGAAEWAKPVIDIMMDGSSEMIHREVEKKVANYYRFQYTLPKKLQPMDKATPDHIKALTEFANRQILKNKSQIDDVISVLKWVAST